VSASRGEASTADDVGYIRKVLDDLQMCLTVTQAVYATGCQTAP